MDCGYALRHQMEHHRRKNGTAAAYSSYVCGKYFMSGRTAPSTHNIYEYPAELTAELLNALIEKILIHKPVKSSPGFKDQEIEIFYCFVGKLD